MSYMTQSALITWGADNINPGVNLRFLYPGYAVSMATSTPIEWVVPEAGRLQRITARHNSAVGNGATVEYVLMVNGVATPMSVALATGAIGSASGNATVPVAVGDRLSIRVEKTIAILDGNLRSVVTMEFV
jgi:hypothetical protein